VKVGCILEGTILRSVSKIHSSGRGGALTVRELMEEQRRRVRSPNPAERLAAALLIPGELSRRLRLLANFEIAQLLDDEVCPNLSILAPEAMVCFEAALRLRVIERPAGLEVVKS
jgi:hypothetical protein